MADKRKKLLSFPSAAATVSASKAADGHMFFDMEKLRKNNAFGLKLAEARLKKKLSQPALAEELKKFNIHVSVSAICKWEKGTSLPNIYQLFALCHIMGIADPVSYFTGFTPEAADFSPELSPKGLHILQAMKESLIASGKYAPTSRRRITAIAERIEMREMKISTNLASAGTGNFLNEDQFETLEFPVSQVPEDADFGIRITGDSMTPYYSDGQIVWVERCTELNPGEVGIFICDNEGYIKQYSEVMPDEDEIEDYTFNGIVYPKIYLVSFNKKYRPIFVSRTSRLEVIGRVLN